MPSICHHRFKFLGLFNHFLKIADRRDTIAKILCFVDLHELRMQVCGNTVTEFLDSVHS